MKKDPKILNSMAEICEYYAWSLHFFYELQEAGMPVRKLRNRWRGHADMIDAWYKKYLLVAEDTKLVASQ